MSHARESRKVHTTAASTLHQRRRRKLWPAIRPVLETLEGRQLLAAPFLGDEQLVNGVTTNLQTLADSGQAMARLSGGGWVVGWSSEVQGSGREAMAQRYDAQGNALGTALQVNTTTSNDQTRISVAALANGGWVAVWQSAGQDGSGAGIYGQRYAADGTKVGGEFAVNQTTAYDQELPSVAHVGQGQFVVSWSGRGPGDISGVFGRRYDAQGNALGDEFRINTWTSNQQTYATVAGLPNGGFLSAWESHGGQDGESAGIYAQRYDASGAAVGSEFRVNTTTGSFQERPAIGVGADGAFIIAWQSNLQDGSQHGIYLQRYAADGTTVGGELRANSYTDGDQIEPSVAVSGSGGFAVAWQGKGSVDPAGVWVQRFDAAATAVGEPLMVNNTTDDAQRYPTVIAAASGYALAWSGRGTGDADGIYLRQLGTAPAASGIADVTVNEDAAPSVIDLNQAFADAENADSELSFQVTANTNTALVTTSLVNGQLTLSYAANASGTAQVTVRATDPGGLSTDSSFTVTVNAVNDAPVAVADAYRLDQNSLLAAEADFGLLANDSDVDGDVLSAVLVSGPSHGTITLNADGSLQYLPAASYVGTDSFSYRATDGLLQSATTSVTLTVVQVNAPPVIGSLVDAPDPAMGGAGLILLAQDVSDDTGLSQVTFYRDLNGNGVLDLADDQVLGADTSGGDGWWVAVSTDGFGQGPHTYFAQATDNQGLKGNVAVAGGTVGPIAVLDDGQPGYSQSGTGWSQASGGRDGDVRVCAAGTGQNTAVWTFEQLPGAYYKVHITWTAGADRASNTPVTIYDGQTVVGTRSVDQQLAPRTFQEDGTWWQYVGTYPIQSGTLRVELSDAANGLVVADAVRIIDPPVAPVVLDPTTNAFTAFDVHGRMGNNTPIGDWELGLTGDTSLQPQSLEQRQWSSWTVEPFTFTVKDNWDAEFTVGSGPTATTVEWDYKNSVYPGTRPTPNALKVWANSYVVGAGLDITIGSIDYKTLGLTFGVAAEVHVLNTGAGTDFRQIVLGNIDFQTGVTITGTVAMHWTGAQPTGSRLQFHIMPVCVADLDADTDNDSFNGQPDRTDAEEAVENKDGTPGKWIAADGRLADTDTSHRFVPLVVDMASLSSLTNARFMLRFDSSILKVWKHDGDTVRLAAHQIVNGHAYTAAELGLGTGGLATLYVQAMKVGAGTVTLRATMDGTVPTPSYRDMDTVKFTAINQHVSCIPCLAGLKVGSDGNAVYSQSSVRNGPVISGTADGRDTQANSAPQMLFTGNGMAVVQKDQVRVYYRLADNAYEAADGAKIQGTLAPSEGDYVEVDPQGNKMVFYGQGALRGKLRRIETVDGQSIQRQYDQGRLTSESQTIGGSTRSSTYEYDTDGRVSLAKVWQTPSGGVARLVRSVEYAYYGASENGGPAGVLKTVKVKDALGATLRTTYYRYYKAGEANGFEYALKYLLDGRAFARAVAALGSEAAVYAATDAQIAPYATDYLKYDSQKRVSQQTSAGAGCSLCAGGVGLGTTSYSYTTSNSADGDNLWKYKTVQTLPDGNQVIVYANYRGQEMLRIEKNVASGQQWITYTRYDDNGQAVLRAYPSAVSGYSEGLADLMGYSLGDYTYLRDQAGLIETTEYYAATDAGLDEDTAGGVKGYVHRTYVQRGDQGTPILQSHSDYFARTVGSSTIHPLASSTQYANTDGSGGRTTSYEYVYRPDSLQVYQLTTVQAAVTTGHNGSGTATRTTSVFDIYGRQRWTRDEEGFINYYEYDDPSGALTQSIVDLDDARLPEAEDLPDGWATPAGGGLHLVTYLEADDQGRTVKQTDPRGNITYTVYNDAAHETRTYGGWDSATNRPTGPTTVWREDWDGNYDESLSMSAAPDVSGGRPTGLEAISDVQSLSRSVYNEVGQMVQSRQYFALPTGGYSTNLSLGTAGTHYLASGSTYDPRGRLAVSQGPDDTSRHSFFDSLSRTAATWVGTDDLLPPLGDVNPQDGYDDNDLNKDGTIDLRDFRKWVKDNPSATEGPTGTAMYKVSAYVYDLGGIGDSNLTQSITYGDGSSTYNTYSEYDWRNRPVASLGADGLASVSSYDNLGEVTQSQSYASATWNSEDGTISTSAGNLRAMSQSLYDELGRVYRSYTYEVDPADGTVGDRLASSNWYNARGMAIKSAGASGLFAKSRYDGAGWLISSYTSFDADESNYFSADDVVGDTVIEQSTTIYDKGGRPITNLFFQRFHDDTTSTGELSAGTSYASSSVTWYDQADRVTNTANFGHESGTGTRYIFNSSNQIIDTDTDGIPDEAEGAPREPDDVNRTEQEHLDYIAARTEYDDAGRAYRAIDNSGRITESTFDLMGRTLLTIENYQGSGQVTETTPTDESRTTQYVYNSIGQLEAMYALNPKGLNNGVEVQDTNYLYESDISGAWATNTIYPDSADTDSSGTDQVKVTYDRLGRRVTSTDQRGVVHTYGYDEAGRLETDAVTDLGESGIVDDSILRIERAYDDIGRVAKITSYDAASAGNIVNEIAYTYDGWGNVIKSRQEHAGAVDQDTLAVQYTYEDGAVDGEAKYLRLASITYPNGRIVAYNYGGTGVSPVLSRVEEITDSTGTEIYAQYSYLGAGTIVQVEHPAVTDGLTLSYITGTDEYGGLDRFGRIVAQQWTDGDGSETLDSYTYAYDRNGNRTAKNNELNSALEEAYTYDGLDRMIDANRNGSDLQDWSLDSLGNWAGFSEGADSQSRTHNGANEIETISGDLDWVDPTYDDAGNMMSGPKPGAESTRLHFVYDAWNRMTAAYTDDGDGVFEPGGHDALAGSYAYDGQGRRIQKTVDSVPQDFYWNEQFQNVETRLNGSANPLDQIVYDIRYVDAPIVRFHDGNTDGDYLDTEDNTDSILFATSDANFNITGVVKASTGDAVEHYAFTPYGERTIFDATWTERGTSSFDWVIGHQGLAYDTETGLIYNRARYLHTSVGVFIQRDYIDYLGGMDLYQSRLSRPNMVQDASGFNPPPVPAEPQEITVDAYVSVRDGIRIMMKITGAPVTFAPDINVQSGKDIVIVSVTWDQGVRGHRGKFGPETVDTYYEVVNTQKALKHVVTYQQFVRIDARRTIDTTITVQECRENDERLKEVGTFVVSKIPFVGEINDMRELLRRVTAEKLEAHGLKVRTALTVTPWRTAQPVYDTIEVSHEKTEVDMPARLYPGKDGKWRTTSGQ